MLGRAERTVALLDRCRPLNARSEARRLLADWQRGRESSPAWIHSDAVSLTEVRVALETVAERAAGAGAWGKLYADRAHELALEAAAVEVLGRPEFRQAAGLRYAVDRGVDGALAASWAHAWCAEATAQPADEPRYRSDDDREPASLVSACRRAVGEQRLPFRVVLSA